MGDLADALTDLSAIRPGSIVLARHGEPAISRRVSLTAQGYREFWADYEERGLLPGQTPPPSLVNYCANAQVLMSSTRPRAIESAQAVAGDREFDRVANFIEAPLPPPNLPTFIKMSPRFWGVVARFWWWWFDHNEGQETKRQAVIRSEQVAEQLAALAASGQNVMVFAHGFFNYMIGQALTRRGWRLAQSEGWKYWSMRRFEQK